MASYRLKLHISKSNFILLPFLAIGWVLPQVAQAAEDTLYHIHTVQAGDNLYTLASQYAGAAEKWRDIQTLNGIKNPFRLVPGSTLRIPLPEPQLLVTFAQGEVHLVKDNASQTLAIGDRLAEGAVVSTGDNSYLSLQFPDNSMVRVLSSSLVEIKKVRHQGKNWIRVLELKHGYVDINVTPRSHSSKQQSPSFEIITPGAVAAVRGTRFDWDVDANNYSTSGVTEGIVAISPRRANAKARQIQLKAGSGLIVSTSGDVGKVRPLLAPPDLDRLVDGSSPDFTRISWPPAEQASAYKVRITSGNIDDVIVNMESQKPDIRLALPGGEYAVSVRAVDADGVNGYEAHRPLSINTHPSPPLILAPAPGAILEKNHDLACTTVYGASQYHIQVATDPAFQTLVVDESELPVCRLSSSSLEDGIYYWRMQASKPSGESGPYSLPARFQVISAPQIASSASEHSSLYWVTENGVSYSAKVSKQIESLELAEEVMLPEPLLNIGNLSPGHYFMRLYARDENGLAGIKTEPREFDVSAPDTPEIERTWFDKSK